MVVREHGGAAEFFAAARGLYETDPVRHTFTLSALAAYRSQGGAPRRLLTVWSEGSLVGAAMQINRTDPLRLSALPREHVGAVVDFFASADPALASVNGPEPVAAAFAEQWRSRAKVATAGTRHDVLHELGDFAAPSVLGSARLAALADLELLVPWTLAYEEEAHGRKSAPETMARILRSNLLGPDAAFLIWEDGGRSVSFACVRRPVVGVSRVGPVFAPKELGGTATGKPSRGPPPHGRYTRRRRSAWSCSWTSPAPLRIRATRSSAIARWSGSARSDSRGRRLPSRLVRRDGLAEF